MNARELQDLLRDLLEELIFARDDGDDDPLAELAKRTTPIRSLHTYSDVGMLTSDKGLVLEMADGTEFQLTIVRSN